MSIPKPTRERNERFLEFVRDQPCVICGLWTVDAHHLETRGSGGSDMTAIPFCRGHHSEYHQIGRTAAEAKYHVNLWRENARLVVEFYHANLPEDLAA